MLCSPGEIVHLGHFMRHGDHQEVSERLRRANQSPPTNRGAEVLTKTTDRGQNRLADYQARKTLLCTTKAFDSARGWVALIKALSSIIMNIHATQGRAIATGAARAAALHICWLLANTFAGWLLVALTAQTSAVSSSKAGRRERSQHISAGSLTGCWLITAPG